MCPCIVTVWMFLPFWTICFETIGTNFCFVAKLVHAFVGLAPDLWELIFVWVWSAGDNTLTTSWQCGCNRSPKLCGNAWSNKRKLVHVQQWDTHTTTSIFCSGLCYYATTVVKVYWAFVVASNTCSYKVRTVFICIANTLHDLLGTQILVSRH